MNALAAAVALVASQLDAGAPSIAGVWTFAERELTLSVTPTQAGGFEAVIVKSPRPAEVGHRALVATPTGRGGWSGALTMPDTGTSNVEVVQRGDVITIVAKVFLFSKTLTWTRAPP